MASPKKTQGINFNPAFCNWLQTSSGTTLEICMEMFQSVLQSGSASEVSLADLMTSLLTECRVVIAKMLPEVLEAEVQRRRRRRQMLKRRLKREKAEKQLGRLVPPIRIKVPQSLKSQKKRRIEDKFVELFGSGSPPPPKMSGECEKGTSFNGNTQNYDSTVTQNKESQVSIRSKLLFVDNLNNDNDDLIFVSQTNSMDLETCKPKSQNKKIVLDSTDTHPNTSAVKKRPHEEYIYEKPCPKSRKRNVQIIGEKRKLLQENENRLVKSIDISKQESVMNSSITSFVLIDDDDDATAQESWYNIQSSTSEVCLKTEVNHPVNINGNERTAENPARHSNETTPDKKIRDSQNVDCEANREKVVQTKAQICANPPVTTKEEAKSVILEGNDPVMKSDIRPYSLREKPITEGLKRIAESTNTLQISNINPCSDKHREIEDPLKQVGPKISLIPIEALTAVSAPLPSNIIHQTSSESQNYATAGTNGLPQKQNNFTDSQLIKIISKDTSLRHLSESIICIMKEKEEYKKKISEADRFSNPGVKRGIKFTARDQLVLNERHIISGILPYFKPKFMRLLESASFLTGLFHVTQKVAEETKVLGTFDSNVYTQVIIEMCSTAQAHNDKMSMNRNVQRPIVKRTTSSTSVNTSSLPTPVYTINHQNTPFGTSKNTAKIPDRPSDLSNGSSSSVPTQQLLPMTDSVSQPTVLNFELGSQQPSESKQNQSGNLPDNAIVNATNYRNTGYTADVIEKRTGANFRMYQHRTALQFPHMDQLQSTNPNIRREVVNAPQDSISQYVNSSLSVRYRESIKHNLVNARHQQNTLNHNAVNSPALKEILQENAVNMRHQQNHINQHNVNARHQQYSLNHNAVNTGQQQKQINQNAVNVRYQQNQINQNDVNARHQQNPTNHNGWNAMQPHHSINENLANERYKQNTVYQNVNAKHRPNPVHQNAARHHFPDINVQPSNLTPQYHSANMSSVLAQEYPSNQYQNAPPTYQSHMLQFYNENDLGGMIDEQIVWKSLSNSVGQNSGQHAPWNQVLPAVPLSSAAASAAAVCPPAPAAAAAFPAASPAAFPAASPAAPAMPEELRCISRDSGFMSPTAAAMSPNVDAGNPPVGRCKVCNQSTYLKCTRCFLVFYCNTPCQTADWPYHQRICPGDAS